MDVVEIRIVRNVVSIENAGSDNVPILFNIFVVLSERESDSVLHTAEDLAFNSLNVTRFADPFNAGHACALGLTGCNFYVYGCQEQSIGVSVCRVTCTIVRVQIVEVVVLIYCSPVARVSCRKSLSNHLVICSVSSVFLSHSVRDVLGCYDGSFTVSIV